MFGELKSFGSKEFFDAIFAPRIEKEEEQCKCPQNLFERAIYILDIGITLEDHICL